MSAEPTIPAPDPAAPADAPTDFRRGVSISSTPGNEFLSGGGGGAIVGFLGIGIMGAVYVVGLVFTRTLGTPIAAAVIAPFVALAIYALIQTRPSYSSKAKEWAAQIGFASGTDTRYRVRVVVPPHQSGKRLRRWALRLAEIHEPGPPTESDLEYVRGGFEPVVARAWFAVRRTGAYQHAVLVATLLIAAAMVLGWRAFLGAPNLMLMPGGTFLNIAAFAAAFGAGSLVAEWLWPTYVRVAPGRLDVFVYPFLARGRPRVRSYRLAEHGLCVHFGRFAAAVEPPRAFAGETEPPLTNAKTWPYHRVHASGRRPSYLSLALTPGRREILCRLVQAALFEGEPTPLPDDELLG